MSQNSFSCAISFCITLLCDRHHNTMMMTEKGSIEHLSSLTTVPSICRFRPSISLRTLSPSWAKTVILWLVALISLVVSSSWGFSKKSYVTCLTYIPSTPSCLHGMKSLLLTQMKVMLCTKSELIPCKGSQSKAHKL